MESNEAPDTEEIVNPADVKVIPDAAPAPADQQDPSWLAGRLERAKQAALNEAARMLGVDNLEKAKAQLESLRKGQEEQSGKKAQMRDEIQRLQDRTAALEKAAERAKQLEEVITQRADSELDDLTETQRAAVKALAGDDKAAQLRAIQTLRPTWQAATSAQPADASAAPPAARVAPASTSAAKTQPASTNAQPTVDHKAEYSRLRATNPVFAAHYLQAYRTEIYPQK